MTGWNVERFFKQKVQENYFSVQLNVPEGSTVKFLVEENWSCKCRDGEGTTWCSLWWETIWRDPSRVETLRLVNWTSDSKVGR